MISHLRSQDGKTFSGAKAVFANQWVDTYIANQVHVAEYWIRQGADRDKVRVVFNGVEDVDVQAVHIHEELGLAAEIAIIVCMGRLVSPFCLKRFHSYRNVLRGSFSGCWRGRR